MKGPLSFLFFETSRRSEKLSSSLNSARLIDDKACVDGNLDSAVRNVPRWKLVTMLAEISTSAAIVALLVIFFGR